MAMYNEKINAYVNRNVREELMSNQFTARPLLYWLTQAGQHQAGALVYPYGPANSKHPNDNWKYGVSVGGNLKLAQRMEKLGDVSHEFRFQKSTPTGATNVQPGAADGAIYDVKPTDNEFEPESIAKAMEDEGCYWVRADKSAGSRKNGLELLRERLQASIDAEDAGIYFMRNCVATLQLLPDIPRDENDQDDVDTESEDHIYDEVRYRVLAGNNRASTTASASLPQ